MTTARDRTPRRFEAGEGAPLALAEEALTRSFEPRSFLFFDFDERAPTKYRLDGDVAVVSIEGPLDSKAGWFWDGYDAVTDRVRAALADPKARAVVLALDSPGGVAAGMIDTAMSLRASAVAAGKPLVAHAGTWATSAAYGLACAADHIALTMDGVVGSVGCIATVYDRTKANADAGLDVRVVRSGALKADPHPDAPLTDASVSRVRTRINELAGMFADFVAQRRPACADPLSLQGATVYGRDALTKGLADSVGTLADAVTTARSLADARATEKRKMDENTRMAATLASLRTQLGVTDDAEITAHVAALKVRSTQLDAVTQERDAARAQLAERDARDTATARASVLAKHRERGALTPAMEADAAFMGDLTPLGADALDRVLSRFQGLPTQPLTPRKVDPIDTKDGDITSTDREYAERFGVTAESMQRAVKRDAERAAARGQTPDHD